MILFVQHFGLSIAVIIKTHDEKRFTHSVRTLKEEELYPLFRLKIGLRVSINNSPEGHL